MGTLSGTEGGFGRSLGRLVSRGRAARFRREKESLDRRRAETIKPRALLPSVDPASHRLISPLVMPTDMFAAIAATEPGASLLQAGLAGDPMGRLLLALVAVAIVIVVGKIVLALAWRIVTIGVVVVAILFLLSTLGLF